MPSSQDELQLQKNSVLDRADNNETVVAPDDLGEDRPKQVRLHKYSATLFGKTNKCFLSAWYEKWDWFEYSVKLDTAFCYSYSKFNSRCLFQPQGRRVDQAFTLKGYRDWKHATEAKKDFPRHADSKDHLACCVMWKEKENRSTNSKEISTLLNSNAIEKNKYYISSLTDVIEFLATHQLAFRGTVEAFSSMEDGGSRLFLLLLNFSIKKDPRLTKIVKTVPRNATYTSHEIQNELIDVMSSIVKEATVQEVGDSWFTLKVDGTRNPIPVWRTFP